MLVDFDHPQALIAVFVQNGLHGGGLACACVAVEQHIVAAAPLDEGLGVVPQGLLLHLIADQVGEHHPVNVVDGCQLAAIIQAEGTVQPEHAHPAVPVVGRNQVKDLVGVFGFINGLTQCLHLFGHGAVVHLRLLGDGAVMRQHGEAVDA